MTVQYEVWLTDDAGKRLGLLNGLDFITYTRAVNQMGTVQFGMPFQPFAARFNPWFEPDWRVEVWRSPAHGYPLRREDVYMLRKPNVYTRMEDGMQVIQFFGRNGLDLLNRRHVIQRGGTSWTTKTDYADDMMKDIVREQMLYGSALDEDGVVDNTRAWAQDEFEVQADVSLGPSLTKSFEGRKVLDILKDIKQSTFQKYMDAPDTNRRIFFDVVPRTLTGSPVSSPLGWQFITRADLYGVDRTGGLEFSLENENIQAPSYAIDHLDEFNAVYVNGGGRGDTQIIEAVTDAARMAASRWNRSENIISASNETTTAGLQDAGSAELERGKPKLELPLVFLNTPGGRKTPRSLYGVNWDLGDKLRVNYAGMQFEAEVNLIYISMNADGVEKVNGRNEVNSA